MSDNVDAFAEEMIAGTMAVVIRHYEDMGHMPEHAIYQAMLRLKAALPKACVLAGIPDTDYHESARFDVKCPL